MRESVSLNSNIEVKKTNGKNDAKPKTHSGNDTVRVIAVTSGKGGVGKTHTTINLGLALTQRGSKVLLLDADLGLANINVMLGAQPAATLHDVISGKASFKDVIISHELGFDFIPAASGIPEMARLSSEERMALMTDINEFGNEYDYMLVDTAAGIGSNVVYFNVAAENVLVVVDPEPTSLTDAYAIIKVLSTKHGIREFGIVANRTPAKGDGRETYAQLAATTSKFLNVRLKYIGQITDDNAVPEAVIAQQPFLHLFPSTKASRDIVRIADKVANEERANAPRGGMQFFFDSLLNQGASA